LDEAPTAVEYRPAVHFWQVLGAKAAKTTEYVPAKQLMHADAPATILYVPASHAMHVCPFSPVYPALQMQPSEESLPAGPCEFVWQLVQLATPLAENVSTGHISQLSSEEEALMVEE